MDFRFQYDRHKAPPESLQRREQQAADNLRLSRGLAYGLTIPTIMLTGPIGGWLVGSWLDSHLHWGFATILLILLGTAASFSLMIQMLGRINQG
jgi:hypothetical protein